jgi:hypothetical protein
LIGEELQGGTRGGERERRHLWRLSETLCLNPAGGLSCHSASSFCSRLQAILLSACTRGKGSIELRSERINREGKRSGLRAGESDGLVRYLSGGRGGARHGGGLGGGGNRIAEEDGRRRRRRRGEGRERNGSAVGYSPSLLLFRFQALDASGFYFFFLSLSPSFWVWGRRTWPAAWFSEMSQIGSYCSYSTT